MSEAPKALDWTFDEDKKTISITWPSQTMQFSAHDLEQFLTALGLLRSEMAPRVPVNLPDDLSTIEFHKHMFVQAMPSRAGTRVPTDVGAYLALQSPLFGWFEYYLDPEYCRGLIAWLQGDSGQLSAPQGTTVQ